MSILRMLWFSCRSQGKGKFATFCVYVCLKKTFLHLVTVFEFELYLKFIQFDTAPYTLKENSLFSRNVTAVTTNQIPTGNNYA